MAEMREPLIPAIGVVTDIRIDIPLQMDRKRKNIRKDRIYF